MAEGEAVSFELEEDDFMDEDANVAHPQRFGSSAVASRGDAPRRTKGRGFRDERSSILNSQPFESLASSGGPGPLRSVEGWIVIVTGVQEEAQEDHLLNAFSEYGQVKNLHLNLDRRTGYVKGYALIEYETAQEAKAAIEGLNGAELLTQTIYVDWAFSKGPVNPHFLQKREPHRHRSRSPRRY